MDCVHYKWIFQESWGSQKTQIPSFYSRRGNVWNVSRNHWNLSLIFIDGYLFHKHKSRNKNFYSYDDFQLHTKMGKLRTAIFLLCSNRLNARWSIRLIYQSLLQIPGYLLSGPKQHMVIPPARLLNAKFLQQIYLNLITVMLFSPSGKIALKGSMDMKLTALSKRYPSLCRTEVQIQAVTSKFGGCSGVTRYKCCTSKVTR